MPSSMSGSDSYHGLFPEIPAQPLSRMSTHLTTRRLPRGPHLSLVDLMGAIKTFVPVSIFEVHKYVY